MLANSGVYFLVLWHCKRVKKALSQEVLQERKWNNPRASYGEGPCWTTGSAWEQKKLGAVFITSMNGTTTHQAENLELSLNPLMPIASTCNLPASPFDFTSKMNYKSIFCSPSHVYTPVPGSLAPVWIITSFLSPKSTRFLLQSIVCTVASAILNINYFMPLSYWNLQQLLICPRIK